MWVYRQGFFNAFAYGVSESIRNAIVEDQPWLLKVCPGCCCAGGRQKLEKNNANWERNPANRKLADMNRAEAATDSQL